MYRMSTNETENKNPTTSQLIALNIICFLFIIPVGLWFSMVYKASGGVINSLLLFAGIYGFAALVVLMYYRMGIQNDMDAKIEKITKKKVQYILGITLLSFMIVLMTIFVLAVNPELITIFENTIGIWFIGLLGNNNFCNEIFESNIFSKLRRETDDPKIFNQTFLLTRFNNENIEDFIRFFKKDCKSQDEEDKNLDLPFDFQPSFKNEGQLNKLRNLVSLKRLVGYFTWIYTTSLISLIISIIGVTMKTI